MIIAPIHEHNDCHDPDDGRFCSKGYLQRDLARAKAEEVTVRFEQGRLGGSYKHRVATVRSTSNTQRDEVLTVLRHELGHGDVVRSQKDQDRLNAYPVTFKKPKAGTHKALYHNSVFADEYLAWKNAIKQSPRLRIEWDLVDQALTAYAKEQKVHKKTLALALNNLRRFARLGRRQRRPSK